MHLETLRSQLLALSRTEGQLHELKNRVADGTSKTELSIIQVLELWQHIFRDTFEQYHRLSTRLVQTEDRASALNLWNEYLLHVQLFLSDTLPDSYVCLNEYRNLCEIHQNVLTSQQAILAVKTDATINIDSNLADKFNQLSALHNETLSRIIDRHAEIKHRLKMWDKYGNDQNNLLLWLKEKEREKSRLQLRYIHLQRIPHILQEIQNMLAQMKQARRNCTELRAHQDQIIRFCKDSAMITSLRMEIGAVRQRIDNLHASLETWRDFLCRISNLSDTYDQKVTYLRLQFQRTQDAICTTSKIKPQTASQTDQTLNELRCQRVLISDQTSALEEITVIQEEIKECLCPSNVKVIRRTIHALWQQQADIDHQLIDLIAKIEDRFTLVDTFTKKYDRFTQWMDGSEHRLDYESCCILYDSDELLRRFEKDLQSEFELREREKDWLLSTGRELLTFYATFSENEDLYRVQIKKKIDIIVERWEKLKVLSKQRSTKIQELKLTIVRLEDRIAYIRAWLHNVGVELNKPIVFESSAKIAVDKIIQENETLQRTIERESSNIGEVLNLCEMVLSDADTWKNQIDTKSLSTSIELLDHRWKHICNASVERKQKIHTIWSFLLEALRLTNDLNSWINKQENTLNELEEGIENLTKIQTEQRIEALEREIREIEHHQMQVNTLTQSYSKLVKCNGIDPSNIQDLASPCKVLISQYDKLIPRSLEILGKLNMDMQMNQKFINLHGKAVVALSRIDAELTKKEHLTKMCPQDKLQSLHILEHEMKLCENDLSSADELGLIIMRKSNQRDVYNIQKMIDEYQLLWKDVTSRITVIKSNLIAQVNQVEDKSIHRSETNTTVQVNTLASLVRTTSITPKDAYLLELSAALEECHENLDELEKEINNAQRKPGSQVVQKMCSKCQSSVELLHHLSNILITECFCSDEEAATAEVSRISSRYAAMVATWKSKEIQLENRYNLFADFILFSLTFLFLYWIMGFAFFNFSYSLCKTLLFNVPNHSQFGFFFKFTNFLLD